MLLLLLLLLLPLLLRLWPGGRASALALQGFPSGANP